jgi:alpha-beta hydrolase superfamily lysophospholipase
LRDTGEESSASSAEKAAKQRAVAGQPVWLALERDPVLAFLYPPEDDGARTAVLFCSSFGWEEMCSYRGRRVWAQALARAGHPTATFNLPGAGDSGGSPREPGQLEAWTAAVGGTAVWLADVTGAERICAIGLGLGGLLACRAVASGAPIDDLVLWAVPARGRMWLREMRTYAEMVASRRPEDHGPDLDREASLEYIGFLLTAETAGELEGLRLTDLDLPDARDRRILLLGRDGLAPDARLREHFVRAGAAVTVEDTDDYSALTPDPQEAQAPVATIEKTIAWLSEPARSSVSRPRTFARNGAASDLARSTIELTWNGSAVRETPLWLDGPGGEMFAVLSEGVDAAPAPVCAVWLNGGALRHTGPNRMWVEAARRWAVRGVPTVRVDLAGIGDSQGEEGRVSNPDLYTSGRTRETLAILDQLTERGLPERYVLGGLCSGAYWSLHAALADMRVAGTLMINLYAFFWSEALVAERDTGNSLSALRGYGWRRLAHRDVRLRHVRMVASSLRPTRLRAGAGHPVERAQSGQIELALDTLREQGTQAFLLFSRGEGLKEQLRRQGVLDRLDRWPNVTLEAIPSTDHMFRALWLQRHVHASLDRALERVLRPA